jgi:hypothetical protein
MFNNSFFYFFGVDEEDKMRSLNVGCGSDPWGDVRVDITFSFIFARFKPTVLADACYLPFKDGSFKVVKASHILEHLRDPFKALDEITRVATKNIILKFPTERDVLPWFISNILPIPSFSALKWTYLTRKKRLHLWVIRSEVVISYLKNKGWECNLQKTHLVSSIFLRKEERQNISIG